MTYRRSIITRGKLLYQQRFSSSFVCIRRDDDRKDHHSFQECPKDCTFMQLRPFGSTINNSTGFSALLQQRRFAVAAMSGSLLRRNMSTAVGEGATEKIDYVADVADVLTETTAEAVASQAQVVNEVAVAAADSFFPVAGLQYFMDYIHSLTGLDWWATIVVSTLLIRVITIPLMISQLKASAKLNLLMPQMEEIKEEISNRGMSPLAVAEGQKKMKALFNENGVNQFSPLKGILFQGPIFVSFFFAISNMVEKVPSFKEGGAFWFTDLTTPDSLYIFPVLTGLTFWLTVECNTQEGMEGNPSSGTIKNISRGFAALSIPLTSGFPKAIFCYWITSSVFSFAYGLVIKNHAVKKFLGVPIITVHQQRASSKPELSFFEALKKYAAATKKHQSSSPIEPLKSVNQQISSNSVLTKRLRSLEKEVKGRKKKGRRS